MQNDNFASMFPIPWEGVLEMVIPDLHPLIYSYAKALKARGTLISEMWQMTLWDPNICCHFSHFIR